MVIQYERVNKIFCTLAYSITKFMFTWQTENSNLIPVSFSVNSTDNLIAYNIMQIILLLTNLHTNNYANNL